MKPPQLKWIDWTDIIDIDRTQIINIVRKLSLQEWPTKVCKNNNSYKPYKFIAKKGHVSIRGHFAWNRMDIEVYARSKNGGYKRRQYFAEIERAIDFAADIVATEEAPKFPKFNCNKLPKIRGFGNTMKITTQNCYDSGTGNLLGVQRSICIIAAYVIRIVSIGQKLWLSDPLSPSEKAWFLIRATGTEGNFYVVTDGEGWYLVRKRPSNSKPGERHQPRWRIYPKEFKTHYLTINDRRVLRTAIDEHLRTLSCS